jgi:hypothetical protein
MATNPLTHHEILELVEPFSTRGRHVDLGLTDRSGRRLAFKPIEHLPSAPSGLALREDLVLENPERDRYRLIRTLTHESGLAATLQMEGRDPAILIEQLASFAPARQFRMRDGVLVAGSYRIRPNPSASPGASGYMTVLRTAEARLPQITLLMDTESGFKLPGEIKLMASPGHPVSLPDDLLAVLGWPWRPLRAVKGGWRGTLKLARREPKRTVDAESKLTRTVGHLVRTLAEPPSAYHARFSRARWVVTGRKALGLLVMIGALASGPLILAMDLPNDSVWRMLAFNTPPFLMLAVFLFPDLPQVRIPSLPRPLLDNAWAPIGVPGAQPGEDSTGESPATPSESSPPDVEAQPPLPESTPAGRRGGVAGRLRGALPEPWGIVRSLWSLARRRS